MENKEHSFGDILSKFEYETIFKGLSNSLYYKLDKSDKLFESANTKDWQICNSSVNLLVMQKYKIIISELLEKNERVNRICKEIKDKINVDVKIDNNVLALSYKNGILRKFEVFDLLNTDYSKFITMAPYGDIYHKLIEIAMILTTQQNVL